MIRHSSIFISHGSPSLVFDGGPARDFLSELGAAIGKPAAIVCISAHWDTRSPAVSTAVRPETIHDFWGFPPALYELRYPAPGAPAVGHEVAELLRENAISCATDAGRGLDHGAWSPLMLMYPQADIPVCQLSVQTRAGTGHHIALGRALAPLKHEGILVLGSGNVTHNLRDLGFPPEAPPLPYVEEFDAWLRTVIARGDIEMLADYRRAAPQGVRSHPSEEHFLPLLVAMAAADRCCGSLLHSSFSYRALSMAAYAFD